MKKALFFVAALILSSCEKEEGFRGDGFFVSQSCLSLNKELPLIIKEAVSKGNDCLFSLKSVRYSKFKRDFIKKNDYVRYHCSSSLASGVNGMANSSKLDGKGPSRIVLSKNIINSRSELTRVIFHELLHLDGTKHYIDIDFPYSCEFHCFENKLKFGEEVSSIAKDICRGKYSSPNDINYIKAISFFFSSTKNRLYDRTLELNKYILKNRHKNRIYKLFFAHSLLKSESYFVGKYYLELFNKHYDAHSITMPEKEILNSFRDTNIPKISDNLLKYGKLVANLFFQIHNGENISLSKLDALFDIDKALLQYTEKTIYNDLDEMRLVLVVLVDELKKNNLRPNE